MFKWPVILLVLGKVLCVNSQTLKYAEKRVINGAGVDYAYHQQQLSASEQQGLSAYAQKMPEQPAELPKNVRTIIVTKKVPVPYPVHVEKKVPVPVKVPIRRPYAVYVPKPYYVEVMKQVPVPVKVPFPQPYTVEKHVPFPFKVHYDKPYPVHITKPYPVYYEKRVPVHVEKPMPVPYKVHVDRPMPVNMPLERPMYFPVVRPFHFPVKVPVEQPVPSHVQKPVPVPVTIEKPQVAATEHHVMQDYYSSTQPSTAHTTFSPSPYDELTSTMLTEGKHKVISFLPGNQNTFGAYGSSSEDIGTIHVSNIKGKSGNSTDWVPKTVPNHQYLTYIPSAQPKFLQYFTEKATKLQEVGNAEPYVVNHGSVKMQYKLHYDPTKQEYSFQLVPKTPTNEIGHHEAYSHQSPPNGESNRVQTEYVYKTSESHNVGSTYKFPSKSENGLTYSYQQIYQSKPETLSGQQSSDSPNVYYPSEAQQQFKQESPYAFHATDSGGKNTYDVSSQMSSKIPEVTYSYQTTQISDVKPQLQHLSSDQHQLGYTYETIGDDGKIQYDPLVNPSGQVSYMYLPQTSLSHSSNSAGSQSSNGETQYSISLDQNGISSEYPRILYQQGRIATVLRDEYETPAPGGKIPENFKTSRTTESLNYFQLSNDTQDTNRSGNDRDDRNFSEILSASANENYQIQSSYQENDNETNGDAPTASIKYEKFGVADVMTGRRTKLYPVHDSSDARVQSNLDTDMSSSSTSAFEEGTPLEHRFQNSETSSDASESPFNAKVYRRPSYKVPRTRRLTRTKLSRKTNDTAHSQDQFPKNSDDSEGTTTPPPLEWYSFFGPNEPKTRQRVVKETNSHTGAAERALFYSFSTSTSTSSTTTSSSLQPPEEAMTIRPTEPLRTRSRGSVRAFSKKKEESSTDETPTTPPTRPKRRRRPARRRMDKATESPVEETTE